MNSLVQFFNRLGLQRVAAMAVVAMLMIGFFAFLIMRSIKGANSAENPLGVPRFRSTIRVASGPSAAHS